MCDNKISTLCVRIMSQPFTSEEYDGNSSSMSDGSKTIVFADQEKVKKKMSKLKLHKKIFNHYKK